MLVAALLAGCQTIPVAPVIQTVIQRVEIPIAVPCKEEIPLSPDFKFGQLTIEDDIFIKSQIILSDRQLHLGYEKELLAALEACRKQ